MRSKPLHQGTVLGDRYEIVDLLKAGGMGAVYKGMDKRLDSICAIKELLPPYGDKEKKETAREWFKREGDLLARLSHSNLPKVTDYFISSGRYYLVMDFIEGEDLEIILSGEGKGGLPEPVVIKISLDILKTLDYLHGQNPPVIYRDVKPANIMIHKDGRAILIDFGIARVLEDEKDGKKTAVGTAGYAPLEQCRGHVEIRSDLYALGATMHHLITGIPPVPFNFDPVRKINQKVSRELEEIIMRALKERPEDRFSSAKEMFNALSVLNDDLKPSDLTLIDRGDILFSGGNYEKALEYYNLSLEDDGNNPEAWVSKGLALDALGRYKEALTCYDNALDIEPDFCVALRSKGMTLDKVGNKKEAIKYYDRVTEIDPDDSKSWNNKGVILDSIGNDRKAVICYDIALNLKPDYVIAWNNKGTVLYKQGLYREAIDCFYNALEIDHKFSSSMENLKNALKVYLQNCRDPLPYDFARLGYHLCESGKDEEGIDYYDIALVINDKNIFAWYNRGLAFAGLNKHKEAIKSYNKVLGLEPEHENAWYSKGISLYALDNYPDYAQEAIKCYLKALHINPRNKEALLSLAFAFQKQSKYEEAIVCYDNVEGVDPDDIYTLNNKGFILCKLGHYKEAVEIFDRVLAIDPDDISAKSNRKLALRLMDKPS